MHTTYGGTLSIALQHAGDSPGPAPRLDNASTPPVQGEPRYVAACRCNAWRLATWPKGAKGTATARWTVARCRSWRHAGECQQWRASVDWRRISDAFAKRPASDVVYLVLTLARESSPDAPVSRLVRFATPEEAWDALGAMFNRLKQRLGRWCCRDHGCERPVTRRRRRRKNAGRFDVGDWKKGDEYGDPYTTLACVGLCPRLDGRYVAVVEQHSKRWSEDGWPHMNVLVHWPWLAAKVREAPQLIVHRRKGGEGRVLGAGPLLDHICCAGFGYQSHGSIAIHRAKLASYLIGAAKGVDKTAAEVAKLAQLPMDSPQGFRRLRSGRGLLAPVFSKDDVTGVIVSRSNFRWEAVSRRRKDSRTWVTDGPPSFRPSEAMTWIDARDWTVYLPDWPGWDVLPTITDDELVEWVLSLDVRRNRGPPRLTLLDRAVGRSTSDENDESPSADARFV